MPKFKRIPESETETQLQFECPGCKERHAIHDRPKGWTFNNNYDNPTVSPSVLVTWFEGPNKIKKICHSFINNGKINFLSDSTHSLAGQEVELPKIN